MLQDNLRFTLTIIGIFVIAAILLHGLWTIRKSRKSNKKGRASFESHNWEPDFEHEDDLEAERPIFDDVGVSKARVIVNPQSTANENSPENMVNRQDSFTANDEAIANVRADNLPHNGTVDDITPKDTNSDSSSPSKNVGIGRAFYEDNDIDKAQITSFVSPDGLSDEQSTMTSSIAANSSDQNDVEQSSTPLRELKTETSANDGQVTIDPSADDAGKQQSGEPIATRANDIDNSPVYSNVVTQPKPEFTRTSPKKEIVDTDFGQPPEFLLKKNQEDEQSEKPSAQAGSSEERAQQAQDIKQTTAQDELNASQDIAPTKDKSIDKSPDFSLNIQEGRTLPKQRGKERQNVTTEANAPKPGVEKELSFAEKAKRLVRRSKKTVADNIRKEPVLKNGPSDEQMRIDFETNASADTSDEIAGNQSPSGESVKQDSLFANDDSSASSSPANNTNEQSQGAVQNDVLVLNVRANNDKPIEGAALLPMLLTLGFKFGEHDIFHRHVHSNGKGPILFSLTNMFKPGVFDIDNLENFNTLGISLFMMLPIDADAQQVFNMMHNAARKLADEFDCRILDGNKVGLSKQSLQQYSERIREFERKRSI